MDIFNESLSIKVINKMTVTVYPQLIHIERDGNWKKFIGWSKKDAIRLFRNEFPLRKTKK